MKQLIYIIAALSCAVLAALYWRQENTLAAGIAAVACVFFLARLFLRERTPSASASPAPTGPRSKAQARRELEEMLPPLRRNLIIMRGAFVALVLGGAAGLAFNPPLGIAVLAFAALAGFLFVRNQRAVTMIETGLRARR